MTLIVPDKVKSVIGTNTLTIFAKVGLILAIELVNPKIPITEVIKERAIGSNKRYNAAIYFKLEKYKLIPNISTMNTIKKVVVYIIFWLAEEVKKSRKFWNENIIIIKMMIANKNLGMLLRWIKLLKEGKWLNVVFCWVSRLI